jgi:hypothetical protein
MPDAAIYAAFISRRHCHATPLLLIVFTIDYAEMPLSKMPALSLLLY